MHCFRIDIANIDDLESLLASRCQKPGLNEATQITGDTVSGQAFALEHQDQRVEISHYKNARVRGVVSDRYITFAVFFKSDGPNSIGNENLRAGDVGWIPQNAERSAVYSTRNDSIMLQLPQDKLVDKLGLRGTKGLEEKFNTASMLRLPSDARSLLCQSFTRQRAILLKSSGSDPVSTFNAAFDHLIETVLDAISFGLEGECSVAETSIDYHAAFDQAEEFMVDHAENLHTIDDICEHLQISRRTLHRAFIEVCGVTPSLYLRHWRLTRAREDFRDGRAGSVTETALRWGFSDVGRFANYYRALFSELPSETLARAASHRQQS